MDSLRAKEEGLLREDSATLRDELFWRNQTLSPLGPDSFTMPVFSGQDVLKGRLNPCVVFKILAPAKSLGKSK